MPRTAEQLAFWTDDLANRFGWGQLRFEGVALPGSAYKMCRRKTDYTIIFEDRYGNEKTKRWVWDSSARELMKKLVTLEKLQEFVRVLQDVEPLLPVVDQQVEAIAKAKSERRERRRKVKPAEEPVWVPPPRPDTLPARLSGMLNEDVEPGFRSEKLLKLCITARMFGFTVDDVDRWTDEGHVGLHGYMAKHVGNGVCVDAREWGRRRLREYDWTKACEIVEKLPAGRKARAVERAIECGMSASKLAVYTSLARCKGEIEMSHGELAASTGYSVAYVNKILGQLAELGALRLIGKKAGFGTKFAQKYELLILEKSQQIQVSEQTLDSTVRGWALMRSVAELKALMIPLRWDVRLEGRRYTVMRLLLQGRTVDEILDLLGDIGRFAAKRRTIAMGTALAKRRTEYRNAFKLRWLQAA